MRWLMLSRRCGQERQGNARQNRYFRVTILEIVGQQGPSSTLSTGTRAIGI
jgi:hypothetical protein